MAQYKVYTGNPVFVGADFYIHKRKRDIGKAANGDHMGDKDIAQVFSRQKEQAGEAAKTFYKSLFLENLKLNNNSMELFSAANEIREKFVGNGVHLRALIEFSNNIS